MEKKGEMTMKMKIGKHFWASTQPNLTNYTQLKKGLFTWKCVSLEVIILMLKVLMQNNTRLTQDT